MGESMSFQKGEFAGADLNCYYLYQDDLYGEDSTSDEAAAQH